jgi:hypothetical protein
MKKEPAMKAEVVAESGYSSVYFFSYPWQTYLLSEGGDAAAAAAAAAAAGGSKEMKWGERWVRQAEEEEEEGKLRWCP